MLLSLKHHNILVKTKQEDNKKEVYYLLTESAEELALIHNRLHEQARNSYLRILDNFNTVFKRLYIVCYLV
ncbi:hypothetical protein J1TS3_16920 [Siminovitchia fordii]|uniref:Uncharacterized protein n=1 Tax=Siminovitchia fordii TaxID=254759 RepID=A0ABQ4K493_9BACI|nr:hypothetical protein J1TS3_16920 [Siminovitchia fordii]